MNLLIVTTLGVLGLIFGSFAGAQVWRLRARQLVDDKKDGEPYDKKELKRLQPLAGTSVKKDHSRCLMCGHQLAAIDLIPLISWLSTGGKCRYCKQPIGRFEPMIELGTALSFVLLYVLWPLGLTAPAEWGMFITWLLALVCLVILFVYDLKWFLLPNLPVFILTGLGVVVSTLSVVVSAHRLETIYSIIGAIVILSGIYALLWLMSRGRWIGFGDVKLGLGLALLLADWKLAFLALFLANFIGCVVVLPGLMSGKISRTSKVPFGPLLIVGAVLAFLIGAPIISWYSNLII